VRCAVRMKNRLGELNRQGAFPAGITLRVGIGVNTGEMVVGNIGGEKRYDYTVIGDSVNLASRTEGLNKEYGTEIIVTEFTKAELGDEFLLRKLDRVAVKGKNEPITIYQVMQTREAASAPDRKLAQVFEGALQAYFERRFGDAIAICEEILQVWPEDGPTKNLRERCHTYVSCPPLMDWDGTWVMMKK
jgi:adenylate cyclase